VDKKDHLIDPTYIRDQALWEKKYIGDPLHIEGKRGGYVCREGKMLNP
jgi:hypothetical protein